MGEDCEGNVGGGRGLRSRGIERECFRLCGDCYPYFSGGGRLDEFELRLALKFGLCLFKNKHTIIQDKYIFVIS